MLLYVRLNLFPMNGKTQYFCCYKRSRKLNQIRASLEEINQFLCFAHKKPPFKFKRNRTNVRIKGGFVEAIKFQGRKEDT